MSILFSCPHCGTETEVTGEYQGLSGPCAVCGKTIAVPEGPAADVAAARRFRSLALFLGMLTAVVCGASLLLGLILSVVWPVADRLRTDGMKSSTREDLGRIAAAFRAYELDYGCLPPAFVEDSRRRPAHSWRVLLLPYLGRDDLYQKYRFSEPWDGPQNQSLIREIPEVYACAADDEALRMGETSYLVIVGEGTLFPGPRSVRLADAADGPHQTLLVVQTKSCGIAWTQPSDLEFQQMRFSVNPETGRAISSFLKGGGFVVTADGQVLFLPNDTPADVIRGAATRNGRELSDLHTFAE